jgi:putative transposase
MIARKAFKFRIYPDATQEEHFRRTVGCCRLVYNLCLDQKKLERERSSRRALTAFDQINELPELKRQFDFLKEAPANSLQQTILDLHKAFKNFFEGRAGFPQSGKKARTMPFAIRIPNRSGSKTIASLCRSPAGPAWSRIDRSSAR